MVEGLSPTTAVMNRLPRRVGSGMALHQPYFMEPTMEPLRAASAIRSPGIAAARPTKKTAERMWFTRFSRCSPPPNAIISKSPRPAWSKGLV